MESSRHNLESRYRGWAAGYGMEGVFCSLSSAVVGFYYCRLALLAWSTCPDLFCDLSARGCVDVNIALVHRPVSLSTRRSLRRFWWNTPFPQKETGMATTREWWEVFLLVTCGPVRRTILELITKWCGTGSQLILQVIFIFLQKTQFFFVLL